MAILCIVIYHTLLWYYLHDPSTTWPPAAAGWARFNAVLGSVRVPLLLFVSGLASSHRVLAGWRDRTNLRRAATSYYLYLVWLLIYAAFFAVVSGPDLPHRITGWAELAIQLAVPDTTLWYLLALCLYVVATATTARWPRVLVILLALGSYLGADLLLPPELQATKVPQNWLFYLLGVYAATYRERLVALARLPIIVAAAAISAVVIGSGGLLPEAAALHSVHSILRSLAMVAVAVLSAIWLSRIGWLRRGLAALGTRTLAIYLIHPLAIYLLIAAAGAYPGFDALRATAPGAVLGPLLVTALITAAGIAFGAGAGRIGAGWLFTLPKTSVPDRPG